MSTEITAQERNVFDWLAAQGGAMQTLLETLVNIDSGSYNKAGVDRVGDAICRFLDTHEIAYETIPNGKFGNAIRATVGTPGERNILLMGHRDTVFPDGEAARRPFRVQGTHGFGPGAADMKAGLVMNCFVAAALRKFGGAPAPVVVLFTADEEIGSPSSRATIEAQARRAALVFNAEPGRPGNAVVTGRKAGIFMRFAVTGKAAHSGANFEQGASAIGEMAHKITALHALTDLPQGITVNVGIVKGGQTVNTVAPSAGGEIDLRYIDPRNRAMMLRKIEAIMAHSTVPGTGAAFEIYGEFLPLVQTEDSKRLFMLYSDCGRALGSTVTGVFTGGCSDAGFSAAASAPTLCAVGPVGARTHSPDEYVELDSIVPRAQVLALTIMRSGESFRFA
jgi:glutamate carboxypeptidase